MDKIHDLICMAEDSIDRRQEEVMATIKRPKAYKPRLIYHLLQMTGFTNSQKLSWMNNIILALEISGSVFSQKFKATGYEWK
jgi:hypothetical protein